MFSQLICSVQLKTALKSEQVIFLLLGIIYVPPLILDSWFLTQMLLFW